MFYYKFYIELPIESFPSTIFYSAFDNALKAVEGEELCTRIAKGYVDEYIRVRFLSAVIQMTRVLLENYSRCSMKRQAVPMNRAQKANTTNIENLFLDKNSKI